VCDTHSHTDTDRHKNKGRSTFSYPANYIYKLSDQWAQSSSSKKAKSIRYGLVQKNITEVPFLCTYSATARTLPISALKAAYAQRNLNFDFLSLILSR
jgi:hypothetical protein